MNTLPPQNRPRYLTAEQEAAVRQAWAAGLSRDEVCRAAGITQHVLIARFADQLRDLPRPGRGAHAVRRAGAGPHPIEIRLATHDYRRSWPEERWLGRLPPGDAPLGLASEPWPRGEQ